MIKMILTILSCALDGEAELFVTGDNKLLGLRRIGKIEIISPRVFREKLKAQQKE